jgi:predicted enzyme related to lactoylglutathione lyase
LTPDCASAKIQQQGIRKKREVLMDENQVKAGIIGWVDLTVNNAEEIRDFYRNVIGWGSDPVKMNGYEDFCMTSPTDGSAVTGICHARGGNADLPAQWLIYVTVKDLDKSIEACNEGGGSIVTGPKDMGEDGRFCVIRDPAGAVAALYEPKGIAD